MTDKRDMIASGATECRMLVIDDSPDIATLIRAYVKDLPIELVIAETGEAGLSRLRESRFDVVLMDYHLPDGNGAETVRELRRWERQFKLPPTAVFALTDLRDFQSSEQMLMAGCTALAGKPLSRHQLLTIASCRRSRDPKCA
jgi:two-component system response regulator DctR